MSEMVKQGSKYTDEDRRRAVLEYSLSGSITNVAKNTGIPKRTLNDWKKTDWWNEMAAKVRHEKEAQVLNAQVSETDGSLVSQAGNTSERSRMSNTAIEQHKPHEKWGDDKKAECAIALLACGSIEKAAKQCHISPKTLGHWSRHDDRFNEVLESLQGEKALEHKHTYAKIVTKALEAAEQGIDKLDKDKLTAGDIKALVVTGATATDKGLLLDGKPTSISGKSEGINELIAIFRKVSQENKAFNESVVATQHPEMSVFKQMEQT